MLIDNKKTREISWNDFELEGNKENLIKQGWESFEPYGSGNNELAHSETFEDWDKVNETEATFEQGVYFEELDIYEATRIKTKKGSTQGQLKSVVPADKRGALNYSVYVKNLSKNRMFFRASGPLKYHNIDANEFIKIEGKVEELTSIEFGGNYDLDFIAWRPVIYKDGDEPLTVIKTPLGNGLTRIQTWGGSADMKLKSPSFGQLAETGTNMTISLYVENNSDSSVRFSNNLTIGGVPYPDGVEYMITVPREYKGFAYLKGEKVDGTVELDIRSDGNIDMMVSQPEIIEGHDLNAMLLIEDLDDGRKHVQVHNVNENTKLVYTGGGVIKGEPYTLETEIENDGRIFNLSANMFDGVVEVQKGMNNIRKSGELQDKELKIEIGVD